MLMNILSDILNYLKMHFTIWPISTICLFSAIVYFTKNPEKFEKWVALIASFFKFMSTKVDRTYIKYDLQGKINDYLKNCFKKS